MRKTLYTRVNCTLIFVKVKFEYINNMKLLNRILEKKIFNLSRYKL